MYQQGQTEKTGSPTVVRAPVVTPTMGAAKLSLLGLLAVAMLLVGGWAAIVPYAGPQFGFGWGDGGAWQWTFDRAMMNLVPGAVALVAGLLMLFGLPGGGRRRGLAGLAGLLTIASGAWLVLGSGIWTAFVGHTGLDVPQGVGAYWAFILRLGYHLGPGLLLVGVGALTWGLLPHSALRRPVAVG
jgi:hypothetical protein